MLTFEKIRELERVERESKKLQNLPNDLMDQLREYMHRKERIKEKTSVDILELENVKNTVKVKKSLPEFVGPDMKTYKLTENEVLTLPIELEQLLLKEGVIEKVEQ
ncbi:hypothetical protein HYZ41_00640 [archaeon]|nr:hypothetical protein [archaeon]